MVSNLIALNKKLINKLGNETASNLPVNLIYILESSNHLEVLNRLAVCWQHPFPIRKLHGSIYNPSVT